MARRADHTREELTELAIQAGIGLIKKEGLDGFSARQVATHIGYTIGTLYNVFGNYDTLILHINARTLDDWYRTMQATLEKNREAPLHALAHSYIHYSRTHYNLWLTLFEYHFTEETKLPDWYFLKLTRFFTMVEKLLLPMLNGNRPKAKRAARILWSGIHGICILSLSGKLDLVKADSPEILAISFIDNFVVGLSRES